MISPTSAYNFPIGEMPATLHGQVFEEFRPSGGSRGVAHAQPDGATVEEAASGAE